MSDWPILSTVTFLPLVGAALVLIIRGDDEVARRNIYHVALWTTAVTFVLSLFIWASFDNSNPGFQMVEQMPVARRARSTTRWASTASRCCSSS